MAAPDVQRREAGDAGVGDLRANRIQGIDQIADRALVHARHAVQRVIAADHGQRRGQRTDRGAGIAHEQVGLMHRRFAVDPEHGVIPGFTLLRPTHTQQMQRIQHHESIVRRQQIQYLSGAAGQRGQQQGAVGNTLRAGQPHRALRAHRGCQIEVIRIMLRMMRLGLDAGWFHGRAHQSSF